MSGLVVKLNENGLAMGFPARSWAVTSMVTTHVSVEYLGMTGGSRYGSGVKDTMFPYEFQTPSLFTQSPMVQVFVPSVQESAASTDTLSIGSEKVTVKSVNIDTSVAPSWGSLETTWGAHSSKRVVVL